MTTLASYAANPAQSRGRKFQESDPQGRNQFQRDRDRIIHSSAFRRLEYKTQVFVNHEGDLFRTRLTHSLEVAQIGRAIARNLNLHEDLVEGIALAHDLGHTPFGHAGQDALNECMRDFGGFEHNLQSLRVVDVLEQRYAEFDGLNLTFELREGILKHCALNNAKLLGDVGERFINKTQPSLEAQLTNLADEIAYNNHDVDDGLRSGLITLAQLEQVTLFADNLNKVRDQYPQLTGRRLIHETVRRMINALVVDLCEQSSSNIANAAPKTIDDVRNNAMLISFSPSMREQQTELKRFLRTNLYQHYRVNRMTSKAQRIVHELFQIFMQNVKLMPDEFQQRAKLDSPTDQARAVADYIAGMTDRYAIREYQRLFTVSDREL
jgi:dGTPase